MQSPPRATADPPAVTAIEITEPTAVQHGFELIDQDAVQLQSLPLRARRVIVRLDGYGTIPLPTPIPEAVADTLRATFRPSDQG